MGCPFRVRVSTLMFLALCAAGCGGDPESVGAAGTAGTADAPIAIEIANTYISVENRTGVPLLEGEMVITQLGVRPSFRAALPRLENGLTRDFTLNTFRAPDGTLFNRTIGRPRSLKLTAKDVNGKTHEQEVPFK